METLDRMLATMRSAFSALGRGEARWVEREGVGALVSPEVPNRSMVNAVICQPNADLEGAYDWLEHEFAGIEAWTVWVAESNRDQAAFLESRGHKRDADPAMMVLDLKSFAPTGPLPEWKPALVEELA